MEAEEKTAAAESLFKLLCAGFTVILHGESIDGKIFLSGSAGKGHDVRHCTDVPLATLLQRLNNDGQKKTCCRCKKARFVTEFAVNASHKDGRSSTCRMCTGFVTSKLKGSEKKSRKAT